MTGRLFLFWSKGLKVSFKIKWVISQIWASEQPSNSKRKANFAGGWGLRGWRYDSFYATETGVLGIRDKISRTQNKNKNKTSLPYLLAVELKWYFSREVLNNYCKRQTDSHSSYFKSLFFQGLTVTMWKGLHYL